MPPTSHEIGFPSAVVGVLGLDANACASACASAGVFGVVFPTSGAIALYVSDEKRSTHAWTA